MSQQPPEPDRTDVVTVFLQRNDRVLVARRSKNVRTYRGRWAGISGYLEREDPRDQALEEILEETGLRNDDVSLADEGELLSVDDPDNDRYWTVHPFRFTVDPAGASEVELDREHREFRWVEPDRLRDLETVPALWDTWQRVRP